MKKKDIKPGTLGSESICGGSGWALVPLWDTQQRSLSYQDGFIEDAESRDNGGSSSLSPSTLWLQAVLGLS